MSEPLHLLVYYGGRDLGPCDYFRLGAHVPYLAELGVEVRAWTDFNDYVLRVPPAYAERPEDAVRAGLASIDRTPIDWADVILFRRWHPTRPACERCDRVFTDRGDAAAHRRKTGHPIRDPDAFVEGLFTTMEQDPGFLRGRAIVYETDDDITRIQPWTAMANQLRAELPLAERMMRRADLVTVTTPVLAESLRRYNDEVRVIRNAIDPALYAGGPATGDLPGDPRICYYGGATRLRDYAVAQPAIEATRVAFPATRRIWIGGAHEPRVVAMVDEALPYVEGVPGFVRSLVNARPDIGVAPVMGDDFDRAKSELHWLDYSMAGAATVASRTAGGGPYDVIRDGVDGILAGDQDEWQTALLRLAGSRTLREELAGRARERVLAEYDVRSRAREWADAYRWAAEHGGRGAAGRPQVGASRRESSADGAWAAVTARSGGTTPGGIALAHRQRFRAALGAAPRTLAALRGDRDVCWPESAGADPLVSVVIPVASTDAPKAVVATIGSVLTQSHGLLEILILAPAPIDPSLRAAIDEIADPRIRRETVAIPSDLPPDPSEREAVLLGIALDAGAAHAGGAWIAPAPAGTIFTPDHVALLLEVAVEHRLEVVYGQALLDASDGSIRSLGGWPPAPANVATGTEIFAAPLRLFGHDPEAWRDGGSAAWSRWELLLGAGARIANVEQIVLLGRAEAAAGARTREQFVPLEAAGGPTSHRASA